MPFFHEFPFFILLASCEQKKFRKTEAKLHLFWNSSASPSQTELNRLYHLFIKGQSTAVDSLKPQKNPSFFGSKYGTKTRIILPLFRNLLLLHSDLKVLHFCIEMRDKSVFKELYRVFGATRPVVTWSSIRNFSEISISCCEVLFHWTFSTSPVFPEKWISSQRVISFRTTAILRSRGCFWAGNVLLIMCQINVRKQAIFQ